ncbi:helix-turn-helix transcriptional regulator [Nocardia sp. NPDC046763]|uniref:helix-turn-helix domain-containing protein n=1 Tax=Nocardia sp. NPDC046763 TaxID=3155256 RepID=UPI00341096A9
MDASADLDQSQIDEKKALAWAAGSKLRGLRGERRLTQQQLADLLGWNKKTIQRFENGEREMTMGQVFELAEALSVSPAEFVRSVEKSMGIE